MLRLLNLLQTPQFSRQHQLIMVILTCMGVYWGSQQIQLHWIHAGASLAFGGLCFGLHQRHQASPLKRIWIYCIYLNLLCIVGYAAFPILQLNDFSADFKTVLAIILQCLGFSLICYFILFFAKRRQQHLR